ncbi:MAG: hypothetical protein Q9M92_15840 [Enterobacterales bacterium]|nr:hypothetical protein [Enterobacterales bacterium]
MSNLKVFIINSSSLILTPISQPMKILACLLLLISTSSIAEIYLAYGNTRKADDAVGKIYSIAYQQGDWRVDLSHFTQYNRSPWYGEHPEWGTVTIPSHNIAAITRELLSTQIKGVKLFLDFGVAYADHLSWLYPLPTNIRKSACLETIIFEANHFLS